MVEDRRHRWIWGRGAALVVLGLLASLTACQKAETDTCGAFLCPAGTVCHPSQQECLLPERLTSCAGASEGQSCSYPEVSDGLCFDQICFPAGCGNGTLEEGEVCDDGDRLHGNGCNADCTSNETCGNGFVDIPMGESCDDGNTVNGDRCHEDCVTPSCGDGIVDMEFNEACDDGEDNSEQADANCRSNCQLARCGDGVLDSGEVCDDGNVVSTDGCSSDCQSLETCGNDYLDSAVGELCDDGNTTDGDGCQGNCVTPSCGDGIVDAVFNEECDCGSNAGNLPGTCLSNNSQAPGAECRTNCQERRCGDDVLLEPTEECDDDNPMAHDGCSSTCTNEVARWSEALVARPATRYGMAMAYDAVRDRVVLFGGFSNVGGGLMNDTWEWDGDAWTQIQPASLLPRAREGGRMVYDATRGTVVLFGGFDGSGSGEFLSDTWEWNGIEWVQRFPSSAPSARQLHGMAYDAARSRVVLFGGEDNSPLGETWEWDGSDWTLMIPTAEPTARHSLAMAYDVRTESTVLFGGSSGAGETWEWDGSDWTLRTPATSPPARSGHVMAYSPQTTTVLLFSDELWSWNGSTWSELTGPSEAPPAGRTLGGAAFDTTRVEFMVFGGLTSSFQQLGDTRIWTGSDWVQRSPSAALPGARSFHAVANDSARGRLVLFGGSGASPLGDTWEFDGNAWKQLSPASSPSARSFHAMAYDSNRQRSLLFGGTPSLNDLWEWDGSDWQQKAPATLPPGRIGHAMAYDEARDRLVLFGGTFGGVQSDTWEWDGSDWTLMTPATSTPPARTLHAMAYDKIRQRVVLFGGFSNSGLVNDVWEWDGSDWSERIPATDSPQAREGSTMAFDARLGKVLLFGGIDNNYFGDLWAWDGSVWEEMLPIGTVPDPRAYLGSAYDDLRARFTIFAGDASGNVSDTWSFQLSGGTLEACLNPFDSDGDGLFGCADPDCWGRCTPHCSPLSTSDWPTTCDPSLPVCGDGVCNLFLETPRLCPADCGAPTAVCGDFFCDASEVGLCPTDCPP